MAKASPPTILVVDDIGVVRAVIANSLEIEGFKVEAAHDGLYALELLDRRRPDLIVTDLEMPGLDGMGLVLSVRQDPRFDDLPILVLSATENRPALDAVLAAGASAVMRKPVVHRDLIRFVRDLLDRAAAAPAACAV